MAALQHLAIFFQHSIKLAPTAKQQPTPPIPTPAQSQEILRVEKVTSSLQNPPRSIPRMKESPQVQIKQVHKQKHLIHIVVPHVMKNRTIKQISLFMKELTKQWNKGTSSKIKT